MDADLVFIAESDVDDLCFAPGSSQIHVLMQSGIPSNTVTHPFDVEYKKKVFCNGVFEY